MGVYRTYTELKTAMECSLKHHLYYEKKLRTKEPAGSALRIGGLAHDFVDMIYKEHLSIDPLLERYNNRVDVLDDEIRESGMEFEEEQLLLDRRIGEVLIRLYHQECYLKEDFEMRATEIEFQIDFNGEFILTGKMDGHLVTRDDNYYVHELKTKHPGFWNNREIEALPLDEQAKIYVFAANSLWGKEFQTLGCLYTVLKKPAIRQRKNDTFQDYLDRIHEEYTDKDGKEPGYSADKYLSRTFIYHSANTMREVYDKVIHMNRIIESRIAPFPWSGDQCGFCDFQDYCKATRIDAKEDILTRDFVDKYSKHEELVAAI